MRLQIPFIAPAIKPLKPPESGDYGFVASISSPHGEAQSLESETEPNSTALWTNSLMVPVYVAALSLLIFFVNVIVAKRQAKKAASPVTVRTSPNGHENQSGTATTTSSSAGERIITAINVVRLAACVGLTILSVFTVLSATRRGSFGPGIGFDWDLSEVDVPLVAISQMIVFTYSSVLSALILRRSVGLARTATLHLNTIMFVELCAYGYRDLLPLATWTELPLDRAEGSMLWAKVALLILNAVVIPLFIPRMYIPLNPLNPQSEANPEQTASVISLVFFYFLDPLIWKGYSVPHLPYEDLPVLADYDHADVLRLRAFKHLDRFSGAPKRYLFWGILRVFAKEWATIAAILIVLLLSELAAPVGVNRLLWYLETGGEGATVRPWVWIVFLFFGPLSASICFEWYIYTTTWILVKSEAIITQLVFEHSLRIRVKAEVEKSDDKEQAKTVETPAPDSPTEPGHTEEGTDATAVAEGSESGSISRSATESTVVHSSSSSVSESASDSAKKGKKKEDGDSLKKGTKGKDSKEKKEDKKAETGNLVGKINNLVTTDLNNITTAREFLRVFVLAPIQIALCVMFLYVLLGWSAFVGLAAIVALLPLPGFVTKLVQKTQKEQLKKKDARVQTVTEIMQVLRMIKLFGWEKKMEEKVYEKRQEELVWIKKRQLVEVLSAIVNFTIPALTMVATFATYTLVMKKDLTASTVFSSMAVFNLLRNRLNTILFLVNYLVAGKVSLDRVNDFLNKTELLDKFTEKDPIQHAVVHSSQERDEIGFHRATFSWTNESEGSQTPLTPSRRSFRLNVEQEIVFQKGAINLIAGPTGSGKTSMLLALLGELHFLPSGPDSWYSLPRGGGVAYAAQESWVLNDTIKNNIIFHSPFDEERYKKVLYQCALETDLKLFDAGDQTEVGEKGLTLSGGQKARITLARAIYSSAEIIMLDDVLAALDVHTSTWIVKKCLSGDLVKGRTVIIVTHNVAMVAPLARYTVIIRDGHVRKHGAPKDVLENDQLILADVKEELEVMEKAEQEIDAPKAPDGAPAPDAGKASSDGKLIVKEEVAVGHVGWKAIKPYFDALGGGHTFLFFLTFLLFDLTHETLYNATIWYLGYWAGQYEDPNREKPVDVVWNISIYTTLLLSAMVCYIILTVIWVYGAIRASRAIHKSLVASVLGTTLRWLDTTPISRVLTRCTQDISEIDGNVSTYLNHTIQITIALLTEFAAVFILTPSFFFVGIVVAVLGGYCGQVYIKAQLSVKREMSNAKAPILAHFEASIAGLASIRAYNMQEVFIEEQFTRTNKYTRAARPYYNLNRWIGVRLAVIASAFSAGLAAYLLYSQSQSPGNTGFSLDMAVSFSSQILWWVRIFNMFEVSGNSLERVEQYTRIEQEPKPTKDGVPPAYWPASGNLTVDKLSARYSETGPKVLHDVSFEIKSGQRIGVVGRTGSGKSSLTLSLLRCIFTEGNMIYDGIKTTSINLDALRSNITIIPQVPELLSGTLRQNLDPFEQYDDAELNDALRSAGLFALQNDMDEGKITLDSQIASAGGNLSVGQRQILALARAIIRKSKLLILDEATSAIDYKTDAIIQQSLRNELKDVTLITIAHRLQTIMDADKILVLDAGRVVEFDSPKELLQTDGKLKSLVDESNDKEVLYAMAGVY